ncbi:MAG: sensor histidine kinase, partial [Spirochaetota bacterium]
MVKVRKIVPLFILVLFTGFMLISCNTTKNIPLANKGVMDLSNWDFTKKGIISLDGEWEFYWNQLLKPSDFNTDKAKMTGYYNVPSVWNNYESKDIDVSGTGYCTLKLVLILPESDYYSLKIREIPTAYRMWIDGKETASNGVVAKSKEEAVPQYLPAIKPFKAEKNKRNTIVLQISNYHFRSGGFLYGIGLGPSELINRNENQNLMFDLFIFGSVLILGIYHLLLYTQRRKQISALYLGLICLLVSLRPLTTNMQFITTIFPDLSWFIELKLEYSIFIGPFLFSLFVKAIYPEELTNIEIKIIGILTIIIVCLILFTPPIVFSNLILYFEIVYTVILLYVIIKIILIAFRKRESSIILAIGSSVFFIIMIIDILFYNKVLNVGNLLPIGFLLLIITQSYLLTIKFAQSFNKNEQLSRELKVKNEKLRELDSQKDEFLANTSHELKTPLNGIVGIAESLIYGATGDLSESTIKNLSLIVKNGKRLNTIVNEILEYSRLKNNNITLTKTYVDIYQIVEQIILFCKPLADKKNIKLNNEIDKNLPYAFADENRLQQILYNLIGNALKFTYEGEVKLSAIACENNIEISVSDTGIGIPKDKQENIFNSFEQADGSILRIYGGTGLGLSISKGLINLHNGSIRVDSEPDKGSVFTFTLPIYKEEI